MQTILVALDGSPRAAGVLAAALSIADRAQAKVVLVRSFGLPPAMPPQVWALPDGSLADMLRGDARAYLESCAKSIPPERLGGIRVELGAPWSAICEAARAVDADLVVVGAHGYSGIDHLLGTTAAKVANHIDRPLLVVRPKPARSAADPSA